MRKKRIQGIAEMIMDACSSYEYPESETNIDSETSSISDENPKKQIKEILEEQIKKENSETNDETDKKSIREILNKKFKWTRRSKSTDII